MSKLSKGSVSYEHPAQGPHHCSQCVHFEKPHSCEIVEGLIQPEDWCKRFMPWTRRQVKYLLSKGSPLSGEQQSKMKSELHTNPAMGHAKKGSKALSREAAARVRRRSKEILGQ